MTSQLPALTALGRANAYVLSHHTSPPGTALARTLDEASAGAPEGYCTHVLNALEAANSAAVTAIVERTPLSGRAAGHTAHGVWLHLDKSTWHQPHEDCIVIGPGRGPVDQTATGCLLVEVPAHAVWPDQSTWADTLARLRCAAAAIRSNEPRHLDALSALAIAHTGSPELPDEAETWPAVQHLACYVGGDDRYSFDHTARDLISAWDNDSGPFSVSESLNHLADMLSRLLSKPTP